MPKSNTTKKKAFSEYNYVTVTAKLPNGKRKYYRGATLKEAEAKRDNDKKELEAGINICDTTTVKELSKLWLELRVSSGLHTRSIETIKGILDRYIIATIGENSVREIQPYDIRSMMAAHSMYSRSTQSKILQYTRSIFDLALENNLIMKNPCVPSIKAGGKKTEETIPLTDDQCKILLEATKGTRAWLFIMVVLYAGLRRGEALGLMWSDIDFSQETLTVNRSIIHPKGNTKGEINYDCKTEASHRIIPMVPPLSNALKEAKKTSKSLYVFSMKNGNYLSETSFENLWQLVLDRSVKTKTKRSKNQRTIDFEVHPHKLRHTCATRLIRGGMDPKQVMYIMGHSSIEITMQIYTHYQEELRRKEAASKMALAWGV